MSGSTTTAPRLRVAVIGAGASGSACAWSMSRHPDKFDVVVFDSAPFPGGVATSEPAPPLKPDADICRFARASNSAVEAGSSSFDPAIVARPPFCSTSSRNDAIGANHSDDKTEPHRTEQNTTESTNDGSVSSEPTRSSHVRHAREALPLHSTHPLNAPIATSTLDVGTTPPSATDPQRSVHDGMPSATFPRPCGDYVNDGVQGATPSYKHVLRLFAEVSMPLTEVRLKISFGKGANHWCNYSPEPAPVVAALEEEIRRFENVLKKAMRWEYVYVFVSIRRLLTMNNFSADFQNHLAFPLAALFFGTGNQTANVSSVMFARVFLDPKLNLFHYDPVRLLSATPTMYAFPSLREYYARLQRLTEANGRGHATFHNSCGVVRIMRDKKDPDRGGVQIVDAVGRHHVFDRLVMACDAESAQRLLRGEAMGFFEKRVLRSVTYYSDVSVTHRDYRYMRRHYDIDVARASQRGDQYFIKVYDHDQSRVEMSFDLSHYQPQLERRHRGDADLGDGSNGDVANGAARGGKQHPNAAGHEELSTVVPGARPAQHSSQHSNSSGEPVTPTTSPPDGSMGTTGDFASSNHMADADAADAEGVSDEDGRGHVFQTIFLDAQHADKWTAGQIREDKVVTRKWWRQFAHTTSHYLWVVPRVRFMQKTHNTFYCGSWTLVNTHEIAVISGLAAAHRLGAPYPFGEDELALEQFQLYMSVSHGITYTADDAKRDSEGFTLQEPTILRWGGEKDEELVPMSVQEQAERMEATKRRAV